MMLQAGEATLRLWRADDARDLAAVANDARIAATVDHYIITIE
jgi:hypothetical protein